jgi:hypothetical protein
MDNADSTQYQYEIEMAVNIVADMIVEYLKSAPRDIDATNQNEQNQSKEAA